MTILTSGVLGFRPTRGLETLTSKTPKLRISTVRPSERRFLDDISDIFLCKHLVFLFIIFKRTTDLQYQITLGEVFTHLLISVIL